MSDGGEYELAGQKPVFSRSTQFADNPFSRGMDIPISVSSTEFGIIQLHRGGDDPFKVRLRPRYQTLDKHVITCSDVTDDPRRCFRNAEFDNALQLMHKRR